MNGDAFTRHLSHRCDGMRMRWPHGADIDIDTDTDTDTDTDSVSRNLNFDNASAGEMILRAKSKHTLIEKTNKQKKKKEPINLVA